MEYKPKMTTGNVQTNPKRIAAPVLRLSNNNKQDIAIRNNPSYLMVQQRIPYMSTENVKLFLPVLFSFAQASRQNS